MGCVCVRWGCAGGGGGALPVYTRVSIALGSVVVNKQCIKCINTVATSDFLTKLSTTSTKPII